MRINENKHKGRLAPILTFNLLIYHISAVLALALLIFSPTFYSCTETNHYIPDTTQLSNELVLHQIALKSDFNTAGVIDVFFFNADRLKRLDSFQRFEGTEMNTLEATSREGNKIISVIANSPLSLEEYSSIKSYDDLNQICCNLTEDSPACPIMYAETSVRSSHEHICNMTLEPLLAKISIGTICCDFHSRPYSGEKMKNVRIYLTNVNGRYPVGCDEPEVPEEILNYGGLKREDIEKMQDSRMLTYDITDDIGENVVPLDIDLYCYQNTVKEETLGTPFTKLVIEGELLGEKTYYPIEINRGEWCVNSDSTGVWRNINYCYDITITRRGVSEPDLSVKPTDITCALSVKDWNEKESRTLKF